MEQEQNHQWNLNIVKKIAELDYEDLVKYAKTVKKVYFTNFVKCKSVLKSKKIEYKLATVEELDDIKTEKKIVKSKEVTLKVHE